ELVRRFALVQQILTQPLFDPNLPPPSRARIMPGNTWTRPKLKPIPENATQEEAAQIFAENTRIAALCKVHDRENNRQAAERKRRREADHRDTLAHLVAELEPQKDFWKAVAVAHGVSPDAWVQIPQNLRERVKIQVHTTATKVGAKRARMNEVQLQLHQQQQQQQAQQQAQPQWYGHHGGLDLVEEEDDGYDGLDRYG